jgi:hypothetical protein
VASWRRRNLPFILPGFIRYLRRRKKGCFLGLLGLLDIAIIDLSGREMEYGLASLDLITDVGVQFVVDALQGITTISTLRFHGLGSSNANVLASNTALASELASLYTTPTVRTTGQVGEGATPNIYQTIGLTKFADTVAVAEWGLFSQASTSTGTPIGGVLFDRSTFALQNVLVGFSIRTTYSLTIVGS